MTLSRPTRPVTSAAITLAALSLLTSPSSALAARGERAASSSTASSSTASSPGRVLWEGGFDDGGLPPGTITGPNPDYPRSSQYTTTHQQGGPGRSAIVSTPRRSSTSRAALQVVMPAGAQRQQLVSSYPWRPDATGAVDLWYGFSIFYASDWNEGRGLAGEVSASSWHVPVGWKLAGDNGSLNLSGDLVDGRPRMVLRRNTVKEREGFYRDGLGLDKLDAGPIVTGRWMDFVVHIRWSTTSTGALRELWRDGRYMGASRSLNAVSTGLHHLRLGQYQTTAISHTRTSYFDNVRIGTSFDAVDPARGRLQHGRCRHPLCTRS